MRNKSVSVVIPAFGRQDYLDRAVASAIRQDGVTEVIVVDDGSVPPLKLQPSALEVGAQLIRCSNNINAAHARNVGIRRSTGDFIAFLDSDDFWPQGYIKSFLEEPDITRGLVFVTSGVKFICPKKQVSRIIFSSSNDIRTSRFIVARSVFISNPNLFFDQQLFKHQDWDFLLSVNIYYEVFFTICSEATIDSSAPGRMSSRLRLDSTERFLLKHSCCLESNSLQVFFSTLIRSAIRQKASLDSFSTINLFVERFYRRRGLVKLDYLLLKYPSIFGFLFRATDYLRNLSSILFGK